MKPEPTGTPDAVQTDDHVQNSSLGAVNPKFRHPGSGRLVPVSAHTPDDNPEVTAYPPPIRTGHDIDGQCDNSSTTPAVPLTPMNDKDGNFKNTQTGAIVSSSDAVVATGPAPVFPRVTPGAPKKTATSV